MRGPKDVIGSGSHDDGEKKTKIKIGLFSEGIEHYWKETGMKSLPEVLEKDIHGLIETLRR